MKQKTVIEGLMQRIRIENGGTRRNLLKEAELRKRQIITRLMKAKHGLLEFSGQSEAEAPKMKMTYSGANEFVRRVK